MNLDAFAPFILPWAHEVPDPTLVFHVRQSAIRFFQLSKAWRETLPAILGDGVSTSFAIPDDQVDLVTLYEVRVNGCERHLMPAGDALALVSQGPYGCTHYRDYAWSEDLVTINVQPAPAVDAQVLVRAALRPSQIAWEIPDAMFDQFAQAIADGALSTLLAMPKQPWTNLQLAAAYAATFSEEVGNASFNATRGNVARYVRPSRIRNF